MMERSNKDAIEQIHKTQGDLQRGGNERTDPEPDKLAKKSRSFPWTIDEMNRF